MRNETRLNAINEIILNTLGTEFESRVVEIHKNNTTLRGFCIRRKADKVGLNCYVEESELASTDEEVALAAIDFFNENDPQKSEMRGLCANFMGKLSAEYIYGHVLPSLVGIKGNEDYLENKLFVTVNDELAITFYLAVDDSARIVLHTAMGAKYNLGLKELLENAKRNALNGSETKATLLSMADLLGTPELEDVGMYVLTNKRKSHGAVYAVIPETMNSILDDWGTDSVVVLPSSIHEVILLRYASPLEAPVFQQMVTEINREQVEPQERLSDSVYIYTRENGLEKTA